MVFLFINFFGARTSRCGSYKNSDQPGIWWFDLLLLTILVLKDNIKIGNGCSKKILNELLNYKTGDKTCLGEHFTFLISWNGRVCPFFPSCKNSKKLVFELYNYRYRCLLSLALFSSSINKEENSGQWLWVMGIVTKSQTLGFAPVKLHRFWIQGFNCVKLWH